LQMQAGPGVCSEQGRLEDTHRILPDSTLGVARQINRMPARI
jgi:hypothetical protein